MAFSKGLQYSREITKETAFDAYESHRNIRTIFQGNEKSILVLKPYRIRAKKIRNSRHDIYAKSPR